MRRFMNIMTGIATASVLLTLAIVSSCTLIEPTGTDLNSFDELKDAGKTQTTKIQFEVEWPSGISDEDRPLYMMVVMNRIQNSVSRYSFFTDAYGNILSEEDAPEVEIPEEEGAEDETADAEVPEIVSEESETPEDGETPGEGENQEDENTEEGESAGEGENPENGEDTEEIPEDDGIPSVRNGFYSVAAVAATEFSDYSMPNLQEFIDNEEIRMREVTIEIPQLSREEKVEKQYIDYNPSYPFIKSISPMYYVRPSILTHTEVWTKNNEIKKITLKPRPLTRKVTIKITLGAEEGVSIDRVYGALSGIPSSIHLMTGYVSEKNTGKMPLEFTTTDGKNFETSINVFGVFSPTSVDQFAGPGILNLSVQASTEESGVIYRRMDHTDINMKTAIDAAEIMIHTDDKTAYRFSDTEKTDGDGNYIEIKEFVLKAEFKAENHVFKNITKEWIITGKGQGFSDWESVEGNDDENANPGLHPEI